MFMNLFCACFMYFVPSFTLVPLTEKVFSSVFVLSAAYPCGMVSLSFRVSLKAILTLTWNYTFPCLDINFIFLEAHCHTGWTWNQSWGQWLVPQACIKLSSLSSWIPDCYRLILCYLLFQPWNELLQAVLIPQTVVPRNQQLPVCVAWPVQRAELCMYEH